ncbi:tRNA pseudouridine(38-40) synthase TruA [Granulicella paludicola]|uniref:tRNA pseudouridine(38-40) synthase TruA n=1 Tax=Granulicella paludicola TaxID=474951 RepID=UPI0021E0443B|nr:tRNA pseudouridine(38-40) synthase TruA [Granulicella paludicola]
MANWKLILSYDGTAFNGWQVQPGLPTVQGTLQQALANVTGTPLTVDTPLPQGSGRTDSGVHALGQVVSVQLDAPIPPQNLLRALNSALPPAIRVLSAELVSDTFHARHSVLRKSYEYRIFERRDAESPGPESRTPDRICSPFLAPYVWDCRWPLALEPMQQAATLLLGTHDFTSFAAADPDLSARNSGSSGPNPVKTLYTSTLTREQGLLIYRVTGSGFLHHMVRNLVGTLTDIGRGALTPEDLPRILEARDRSAAGPTAPAHGLYLVQVDYPPTPSLEGTSL